MTAITSVSGTLSKKDIKRLTSTNRSGAVGPTTVYYAGVIAPIISASVALVVRIQLSRVEYFTDYWSLLISTLIAAFAGISWYLIFMRWSYRHSYGRGDETTAQTDITVTEQCLLINRGLVKSNIGWGAIAEVRRTSKSLVLFVDGSDPILVPDTWFGKDNAKRDAFKTTLESRIGK